ncbi:alpha/beta-hydrolase [Paramyrothecium foliicola]|nr:alpha/beta-hydrolase [Paramyrothecium foliicola]
MASDYPPPLIIPPLSLPHKHTFILLHGRGSNGEKFGPTLLETPIVNESQANRDSGNTKCLAKAFPHARFVFPTAARRRATVYRRAYTHQWFDNWKLDPPAVDREELQVPGLHETVLYLHGLLKSEIAIVPGGAANIIFGGLSQGCAASLVTLLLWEGDPIGAAVGMCGWLPFRLRLEEQVDENGDTDQDEDFIDVFEAEESQESTLDPPARAIRWLRDELDFPTISNSQSTLTFQKIPLFLGHGVEDDRVNIVLGREASKLLNKIGFETLWKEYGTLGHWYSADLLGDMVEFLRQNVR